MVSTRPTSSRAIADVSVHCSTAMPTMPNTSSITSGRPRGKPVPGRSSAQPRKITATAIIRASARYSDGSRSSISTRESGWLTPYSTPAAGTSR